MLSPGMLLYLSTMACAFLSSAAFLLLLCMERQGKSRAFPPGVSGKDQEVIALDKRLPTYHSSG